MKDTKVEWNLYPNAQFYANNLFWVIDHNYVTTAFDPKTRKWVITPAVFSRDLLENFKDFAVNPAVKAKELKVKIIEKIKTADFFLDNKFWKKTGNIYSCLNVFTGMWKKCGLSSSIEKYHMTSSYIEAKDWDFYKSFYSVLGDFYENRNHRDFVYNHAANKDHVDFLQQKDSYQTLCKYLDTNTFISYRVFEVIEFNIKAVSVDYITNVFKLHNKDENTEMIIENDELETSSNVDYSCMFNKPLDKINKVFGRDPNAYIINSLITDTSLLALTPKFDYVDRLDVTEYFKNYFRLNFNVSNPLIFRISLRDYTDGNKTHTRRNKEIIELLFTNNVSVNQLIYLINEFHSYMNIDRTIATLDEDIVLKLFHTESEYFGCSKLHAKQTYIPRKIIPADLKIVFKLSDNTNLNKYNRYLSDCYAETVTKISKLFSKEDTLLIIGLFRRVLIFMNGIVSKCVNSEKLDYLFSLINNLDISSQLNTRVSKTKNGACSYSSKESRSIEQILNNKSITSGFYINNDILKLLINQHPQDINDINVTANTDDEYGNVENFDIEKEINISFNKEKEDPLKLEGKSMNNLESIIKSDGFRIRLLTALANMKQKTSFQCNDISEFLQFVGIDEPNIPHNITQITGYRLKVLRPDLLNFGVNYIRTNRYIKFKFSRKSKNDIIEYLKTLSMPVNETVTEANIPEADNSVPKLQLNFQFPESIKSIFDESVKTKVEDTQKMIGTSIRAKSLTITVEHEVEEKHIYISINNKSYDLSKIFKADFYASLKLAGIETVFIKVDNNRIYEFDVATQIKDFRETIFIGDTYDIVETNQIYYVYGQSKVTEEAIKNLMSIML